RHLTHVPYPTYLTYPTYPTYVSAASAVHHTGFDALFLAEDPVQNFSHRAHRQTVSNLDLTRHLELGEAHGTMRGELLDRGGRAGFHHHERFDDLAVIRVRHADDRHQADGRVRVDHAFDVRRIDVETVDDDHVLLALDDRREAIGVHARDVAGMEPHAVRRIRAQRGSRLRRLVPVALHHLRPGDA